MTQTAQKQKIHILITDASSFLGKNLAKSFLDQNCIVYAINSSRLPHSLLAHHDFTLLDIDLAQPLPNYLPQFDLIFHLVPLGQKTNGSFLPSVVSIDTANLISYIAKTEGKIFVFAPITTSPDFYDYLIGASPDLKKRVKLLLTGDLYGPDMSINEDSQLADLIGQAAKSDKVVLKNEGLNPIYPAYITDVIFAVNKIAFSQTAKNIYFLVSQDAVTTLSCAYEIQHAIAIAAGREVNLFFSGSQLPQNTPNAYIKIHDLGFVPKVDLQKGLRNTFEFFAAQNQIVAAATTPVSQKNSQIYQKPSETTTRAKTLSAITIPLPTLSFGLRTKTLVIGLLALFVLTLTKTGLDLYLGSRSLSSAQASLLSGDFEKAINKAAAAKNSFQAAYNKILIVTSPITLISQERSRSLSAIFEAQTKAAASLLYFARGAQALGLDLKIITHKEVKNDGFDLETPASDFKKAYLLSQQAAKILEKSPKLGVFAAKMAKAQELLNRLNKIASSSYELSNLTADLTGHGQDKTYLVLLQNNTELRPGGGFIGNFAIIEFAQGRLKNIQVEDIYTIDGQLAEKIEPPAPLSEKLGIDRLYLRDSNWSLDFGINAKTARDFFKKETGRDVDGVIAIDLSLLQKVLAATGPINLTDYNEQISAQNLFEKGEYYSEIGFFPGSTQKRDFFATLTRALIAKVLANFPSLDSQNESQVSWPALAEVAKDGLLEKHLLVFFDNPTLSSYVMTHGWDNPLATNEFDSANDQFETRDFIALAEANVGANKVNRFLERKIAYEMTIGRDADLVGMLKISYTNNSQAETWPAGKYVNYLRVYLPFAAGIEEFNLSIPPPRDESKKKTKTLTPKEDGVVDTKDVEVTTQGNLTIFSTYVEVPIKSTQEVNFTYRIPKNIKLEQAPIYHLYIQKQPGTDKDPLEFKFNLPAYLEVKSVNNSREYVGNQNITINTDLSTDRQFAIELAKK